MMQEKESKRMLDGILGGSESLVKAQEGINLTINGNFIINQGGSQQTNHFDHAKNMAKRLEILPNNSYSLYMVVSNIL